MKIRKAVFPVAGLGTRFLPATKASPKEMLPIVDKPLIQYAVEEAIAAGIEEIIMITGRGKNSIEDHFDRSIGLEQALGVGNSGHLESVDKISEQADFCYIRQREPLGLGHAILRARGVIGDEPFAVLLGDDVIRSERPAIGQLIEKYYQYESPVVALEEVDMKGISNYGVIDYETTLDETTYKVKDMVEKPEASLAPSNLAIIGRYILTPDIFPILEKQEKGRGGEIQLTDGMRKLLATRDILGYKFQGERFDAGSKIGFLKATVQFALNRPDLGEEFLEYLKMVTLKHS